MTEKRDAKRFPRRLPRLQTDEQLNRMARMPSHLAPYAEELLEPEPFTPPTAPTMSMMERGLLEMVLEQPNDDAPRRQYADWLIAQGDIRGEFIKVQLEIASFSSPPGGRGEKESDIRLSLLDREAELLRQHEKAWTEPFAPWSAKDFKWRRGFIEGVSLSGRCFISISDGLFDAAPINDVRLVAITPYIDELAQTRNLSHLYRLDLTGCQIPVGELSGLMQSEHLTQLQSLGLGGNPLGAGELAKLTQTPGFKQLQELDAANAGLYAEQAALLMAMPTLRAIDVSGNPIGRLPNLGSIQQLNVSECRLKEIDYSQLQECQRLGISFNRLNNVDGVESLTMLCQLNVAGNRLPTLPNLHAPQLRELDISVNPLGETLLDFFEHSSMPRLQCLNVCNTQLTDAILMTLAKCETWSGLQSLNIAGNSLSIRAIFAIENLQQLRELTLSDNDSQELRERFPRVRFIR